MISTEARVLFAKASLAGRVALAHARGPRDAPFAAQRAVGAILALRPDLVEEVMQMAEKVHWASPAEKAAFFAAIPQHHSAKANPGAKLPYCVSANGELVCRCDTASEADSAAEAIARHHPAAKISTMHFSPTRRKPGRAPRKPKDGVSKLAEANPGGKRQRARGVRRGGQAEPNTDLSIDSSQRRQAILHETAATIRTKWKDPESRRICHSGILGLARAERVAGSARDQLAEAVTAHPAGTSQGGVRSNPARRAVATATDRRLLPAGSTKARVRAYIDDKEVAGWSESADDKIWQFESAVRDWMGFQGLPRPERIDFVER